MMRARDGTNLLILHFAGGLGSAVDEGPKLEVVKDGTMSRRY